MANELTRGQRLRDLRKSIGWSQFHVAAYLGISQATVSLAENDAARVKPIYWVGLESFCDKVVAKTLRYEDRPSLQSPEESTE